VPLPLPNLDDRRWNDLVEEGCALVPRYARAWTDHNISDPGITLIELFAWMTESSVYALNRITPRHRRKFVSLLGCAPHPPQAAHTMLAVDVPSTVSPFELAAGFEVLARSASGDALWFRTERRVTASHVQLAAVLVDVGKGPQDRTIEWRNGLPIAVFGNDPQPGSAVYFGFDAIEPKTPVSFALRWDRPGTTPEERALQSRRERARLIDERIRQRRACRAPLPDIPCPGAPSAQAAPPGLPPHHSARVVWETWTGAWTPMTAVDGMPSEGQVRDDTRSLTLDGVVELALPAGIGPTTVGTVGSLVYVRCRLDLGAYDSPPVLMDVVPNAVPAEQCVPLCQRFAIPAGVTPAGTTIGVPKPGEPTRMRLSLDASGIISALTFDPAAAALPDVRVLAFDKVPGADGHLTVGMVYAGRGDGLPNQQFTLPNRPLVDDDAVRVYSHDGTSWQRWEVRPTFDASRRTDWHSTIDWTHGVVTFGDGERGRVLASSQAVFVVATATAAAAATLPAGSPVQVPASPHNDLFLKSVPVSASNLAPMIATIWPAAGGADEETVDHAAGRAAESLHAHERLVDLAKRSRTSTLDRIDSRRVRELSPPSNGVSLLDLERLALDVPGTRVARARAWADVHPQFPCLSAPGWITLVVMPVSAPAPSPGLLRVIRRYLSRRRMVTTMLHVVGPRYVSVAVRAIVRLTRGADGAIVKPLVETALKSFLDPRTGGPDGLGWPFGRDVYRAEILQLIDAVAGVDHVLDLALTASGGTPQCGNLTLCPTWLAAPGQLDIEIV
jgi:hypothetical protein